MIFSASTAYCLPPTAYSPLALVFLSPLVAAAGIGLVGVPILIHILNRQRFKVVQWAAMDFLLRAMKKNRRRTKFEQLILLATRCLVMLLIAFALARPMAGCSRQSLAGALGGRSGLNVLVIDNSYSAAYQTSHPGPAGQPGGKTHLEQEKLIAKRLIDGLNAGGESVAIITAARPATAVIAKPGYDLTAAKAAVDRIESSFSSTDLAGALQLAEKLGQEESKAATRTLYLLTDGTRSAWEGPQAETLRRIGPELAKLFHVTHYNMTEGRQQWNGVVTDVRPATNLVTTKFPSELLASPKGFGTVPDAPLEWWLDGAKLGDAKTLKLDPGTEAQKIEVQPRDLKTGGPRVFRATIGLGGNDPLPADNARLRVVDVAGELKVLIVEGNRGNTSLEGSGAFLQVALSPPAEVVPGAGGPKTNSYVSADLISDIDFRGMALADYRTVVLAGVGQLTEPEADGLRQFVERGGTLMVFMGEPVSKENYNAVLLPRKLLPGPLVKLVDAGTDGAGFSFDFKPNAVLHPYLRQFANQENTGLDTAKAYTYWQIDVPAGSGVERVLNYLPQADKPGAPVPPAAVLDPAVTHHTLGLGHVIFFATSASPGKPERTWTTFPAKQNYVSLMHELLAGGIRPGDYWMNLTVGQPLEIPPTVKLAGNPELHDDAGTAIPLDPITELDPATGAAKPTVYRSRPMAKPGQYALNLGTGTVPVVVNVPPEEADVRTIGNDQVRKALGDIELTLAGDIIPAEASLDAEGQDWAGPALIAVLLLLAAEGVMAMAFGHYRRHEVAKA